MVVRIMHTGAKRDVIQCDIHDGMLINEETGKIIYGVHHQSATHGLHSGMDVMVRLLGMHTVCIPNDRWTRILQRSWTLGNSMRYIFSRISGSEMNLSLPIWDDIRILNAIRGTENNIVIHYIWGEMCSPLWKYPYMRSGAKLIGTFHATPWKQQQCLTRLKSFHNYDFITVMSQCQIPFFVERGYPIDRISVVKHGVDSVWFSPKTTESLHVKKSTDCLQCGTVGKTERDHHFLAELVRGAPSKYFKLNVLTSPEQHHYYDNVKGVELLPRLSDRELLEFYQQMDLILLPVRDCTANNALLEAMSCGTPVLINDVGGASEYVPRKYLLPSKDIAAWLAKIQEYYDTPQKLEADRGEVRKWAEGFDWKHIAPKYLEIYRHALEKV